MQIDNAGATAMVPAFVVIYRGVETSDVLTATEQLLNVGYGCFEVSLTSQNALDTIQQLHAEFGSNATIGAGTVRSVDDVLAVFDAGAELILSPETDAEVIRRAKELGMVTIPGAYTPTEVSTAHRHGADVVKLFPAGATGHDYFRLLREPFPEIPILVTGGVTATAAKEYFDLGAVSVGVGVQLLAGTAVLQREWKILAERASEYWSIARGEGAARTEKVAPTPPVTRSIRQEERA